MSRILLIIISCIFLFISCVQNKAKEALFEEIESCMESHPDSALTLLREMENPEALRGQEQADYALLLTQAYD